MRIISPKQPRVVLVGLWLALLATVGVVSAILTNAAGAPPWVDTISLSTADTAPTPINTADQAVKRGEAILLAHVGRSVIAEERPLVARRQDSVWTVSGTLPQHSVGGVGTVVLPARDGHVIRVYHPL